MENYLHKDEWKREGENFTIVVSRHSVPKSVIDPYAGTNRWCVYAYIYPKHKYFDQLDLNGEMYQDATQSMPLHCGCTFFKVHKDDELVTSVQIGADYNHLYDDRFNHMDNPNEAHEVFKDSDELFEWLTNINTL